MTIHKQEQQKLNSKYLHYLPQQYHKIVTRCVKWIPSNVPKVGVHHLCTHIMYSYCIRHGSCHLHIRPKMDKTAETEGYMYTQEQAYKSTDSVNGPLPLHFKHNIWNEHTTTSYLMVYFLIITNTP